MIKLDEDELPKKETNEVDFVDERLGEFNEGTRQYSCDIIVLPLPLQSLKELT